MFVVSCAALLLPWIASAELRVPLRSHQRVPHWQSFLALGSQSEDEAKLEHFRLRHNNTHAIEYYGDLSVGGQNISVLFDTGSDQLLVPGAQCVSSACSTHRLYDESQSKTARNSSDLNPSEVEFGTGHVLGYEQEDQVCLAGSCARVQFVEVLEESDDPFNHAGFDGVLGLALNLRRNATRKTSVLQALADSHAIPSLLFAVFLSKDLHMGTSEILFGRFDSQHADGPLHWVPLSEPGYWQFSIASLSVGGKKLPLCGGNGTHASLLQTGTNVSTFFGRMCCRSLEEFEHESRCQYHENYTRTGNRSRYTDRGHLLATYADGRVAVQMHDGCVQKVPRAWLSLPTGCRGDGTVQAVLDTGSSLMMGPVPIVQQLLTAIGAQENCTKQVDKGFPTLSFALPNGPELTLAPEDYMDQLVLADGVYCWPHLMPFPETAKGAVLVLGMPFLRAFYSVFDAGSERLGFAKARQVPERQPESEEHSAPKKGPAHVAQAKAGAAPKQQRLRAVRLHGRRPGDGLTA
mmetsp:Transcript_33872/g.59724  ORF Transcript_33872/g.59724 Transcript_33872/m.59724 type:complete len:520 (+) Transcript_33872:84-1643(+)